MLKKILAILIVIFGILLLLGRVRQRKPDPVVRWLLIILIAVLVGGSVLQFFR